VKYAVISFGNKQHKVSAGDEIFIPGTFKGKTIEFDQVLLFVDDKKVLIGKPTVKDAKVKAEVQESKKGKKIKIVKYKAKSRYRKTKGFRPILTKVKITSLDFA
jgi:large subunit ribosomal protein L21